MTEIRLTTIHYFIIAISLHISILLLMSVYFNFFYDPVILGSTLKEVVVNSFMEMDNHRQQTTNLNSSPVLKQVKLRQEKIADQGIVMPKQYQKTHQTDGHGHAGSKLTVKNETSQGENPTELLTLLHAAIQAQQHYPMIAEQMEREGRVTLKFMLFPNGIIDHIQIVSSSGTDSLDQAALLAVNAAVPFKHIEKYLHDPQEYTVDVVFQLS